MRTRKQIVYVLIIALLTAACQTSKTSPESINAPSIEDASASPTADAENPTQDSEEGTTAPASRVRGVFVLQIVPEDTEARYIVEEEFFGQGFATAIGVTSIVEGEITIDVVDTPTVLEGEFRVDLRSLTSDESRRDNAIRSRWLESDEHPFAVFVPTAVTDFPSDFGFNQGEEVRFVLHGDMTIRDVTQRLSFDVTAVGHGDILQGRATTQFLMTDFGFDPPSIINILAAENEVKVELDFTLRSTTP